MVLHKKFDLARLQHAIKEYAGLQEWNLPLKTARIFGRQQVTFQHFESMDDATLPLVAGGGPAEAAGVNFSCVAAATPIHDDGGFVYSPHE
ncbi:hypothetical protein IV203_032349 [Nitzschia inconspicua]|uniref:Uncharacterized protein n=1 Tax=Nitzschia inconspicua TaxID=303405 RepID=A0A9K3PEW0_9STRA|nr:hypothetical protein IV203_032349 [Nitzschia inconspicua]